MSLYKVSDRAPLGLFLRSQPVVSDATKIAVLPMGQEVTKLTGSSTAGWWEVSTTIQGTNVTGFVKGSFLDPASSFTPPQSVSSITPVHLHSNQNVTLNNRLLAFPLNVPGQPTRNPSATPDVKAQQLTTIVSWLDVENKARSQPNTQHTYCNIYAYDYCYLAGVYLPRVWWTSSAIASLQAGNAVSPIYGQTVNEINANSLFNWLSNYGPTFGWRRTFDLTEMQNAANDGQVVIISARNKVPNRSGHICAVVPETTTPLHKAIRNGTIVTNPLQSQAGRTNRQYMTRNWWIALAQNFNAHGFWINAT